MDWSNALSRIVVPKRGLNAMRFQGERGLYEAWYLTFNARPDSLGVWIRYTIDTPIDGPGHCALWGHVFDARSPKRSFGFCARYPLTALSQPPRTLVQVGDARLEENRARGAIRQAGHSLEWDLRFDADPYAVHLTPYPLRALGLASTEVVFANPDAHFSGTLVIDGREVPIRREPGSQTHLWGKKHVERWAWAHCNAFDGRDDCSIDGVAAYLKPLRALGPLTGIYVRYRGQDYCLNALPGLLSARSEVDFPLWRFDGRARDLRFEGTFRVAPERLLQVTYDDPDREKSFCANSEVADLSLTIRRGRRLLDRLAASGTAHLEFGSRAPWAGVRATV